MENICVSYTLFKYPIAPPSPFNNIFALASFIENILCDLIDVTSKEAIKKAEVKDINSNFNHVNYII